METFVQHLENQVTKIFWFSLILLVYLGSALMEVKQGRFVADGILSFTKGCRIFLFGEEPPSSAQFESVNSLDQRSNNPNVYTKLSCFLPWIAQQYGLDYQQESEEETECSQETGNIDDITDESEERKCRGNPTFRVSKEEQIERSCIFPFYYDDRLVEDCIQLGTYLIKNM